MRVPGDIEITDFFARIAPEFFTHPLGMSALSGPAERPEAFDRFVLTHLAELADLGRPFAELDDGLDQFRYTPGDDETLDDFLARLRREAQETAAVWFFVGVPSGVTRGGWFQPRGSAAGTRVAGRLHTALDWYAESISPAGPEQRFGTVVERAGQLQIVRSSHDAGANPAFREVLRR